MFLPDRLFPVLRNETHFNNSQLCLTDDESIGILTFIEWYILESKGISIQIRYTAGSDVNLAGGAISARISG